MNLLQVIVWGLVFYIVMKIYRSISQVMKSENQKDNLKQQKRNERFKTSIDSKDIIEAEFEEVPAQKQTK